MRDGTKIECPECGEDRVVPVAYAGFRCTVCGEYFDLDDVEVFEPIRKRKKYEDEDE
jgi:transcription elongation factor Elf1